jgi:sterol 14-demethylase
MPEYFPDPTRFDPSRYAEGREEDKQSFAWIPFGAGRHRCVGAAFAMMQLKAIFSVILRRYDFEMLQPPDSYANDHSKMVVQLKQPARVRYRRRAPAAAAAAAAESLRSSPRVADTSPAATGLRVLVDADLCQGHGVCVSECPEAFELDPNQLKVRLRTETIPQELRAKVEAAVQYCPTRALRIQQETEKE